MSTVKSILNLLKYSWALLLPGILFVLLSVVVITFPINSLINLSIFFSGIWMISGISMLIFSIKNRQSIRGWAHYLESAIVDIILSLILLSNPKASLILMSIIIGFWLMLKGIILFIIGIEFRPIRAINRWLFLGGGLIAILIAIYFFVKPESAFSGIMVLFGISMLIIGALFIILAFIIRKTYQLIEDEFDD